jgi:hypothetical protein
MHRQGCALNKTCAQHETPTSSQRASAPQPLWPPVGSAARGTASRARAGASLAAGVASGLYGLSLMCGWAEIRLGSAVGQCGMGHWRVGSVSTSRGCAPGCFVLIRQGEGGARAPLLGVLSFDQPPLAKSLQKCEALGAICGQDCLHAMAGKRQPSCELTCPHEYNCVGTNLQEDAEKL